MRRAPPGSPGHAGLRRPALPHARRASIRWPIPAAVVARRGRARAYPPRDHGPRPDRWRAPARDAAPDGLTVIVGEECKTADGDLICLFLERAVAPGRPALADDRRGPRPGRPRWHPAPVRPLPQLSARARGPGRARRPARLGRGVQRAADRRRQRQGGRVRAEHDLPGVAVSDAHTVMEVGDAYTVLHGRPDTAGRSARRARGCHRGGSRPRVLRGAGLHADREDRPASAWQWPDPRRTGRSGGPR